MVATITFVGICRTESLEGFFGRATWISSIHVGKVWRSLINFGACCQGMLGLFFPQTNEFSIKPLKVKIVAGEQKTTELRY